MNIPKTPEDSGLKLDLEHLNQAFEPIPSISVRFPPIYKLLIAANAKKEWVDITRYETNWFQVPMMAPHLHSKLWSLLEKNHCFTPP